MGHTRGLDELGGADGASFGGKSASLGELLSAGIPVPPGFALAAGAFEELLAGGEVERTLEAIRAASVPDGVRDELGERYAALAAETGQESPAVAVRSSAIGEDSAEATFAGQQDSYLWVHGIEDICEAVRRCWASLYNPEAVSYRARLSGDAAERPAMGVTVQLMVDAAVSGVMFTCNPVTGDPSTVAINASWGLGLAVVGGEVTPDDYLVSKVTRELVRSTVNDKHLQYAPATDGRGTMQVSVDEERRRMACLEREQLHALVDMAKRVQQHFGAPQDVEWAIDQEGALFVLQSRPVTALPKREAAPVPGSAMSLVMAKFGAGGNAA